MKERRAKEKNMQTAQEFSAVEDLIYSDATAKNAQIINREDEFNDIPHIQKRSKIYTDYLQNYVINFRRKNLSYIAMKIVFFCVVIVLLAVITVACFACIKEISKKENIDYADAATAITAIAGLLVSFLSLPKLICNNLFPQSEEDKTAEIFNKMFEHDVKLRELHHANKDAGRNETGHGLDKLP